MWVQFENSPDQVRKRGERYEEALSLIRQARTTNDGFLFLEALNLVPADKMEEQFVLRREWILSHTDYNDVAVFGPDVIVVPTTNMDKPVWRKDGQVHSFKALPFPGHEPYSQNQYQVRTGGQFRGMKPGR